MTISTRPAAEPAPSAGAFERVRIATERCKGCGLCVAACPHHALALDTSFVNERGYHPVRLIDGQACTSCALCARVCPDAGFTVLVPPKGMPCP